jgi:hypothetical protein
MSVAIKRRPRHLKKMILIAAIAGAPLLRSAGKVIGPVLAGAYHNIDAYERRVLTSELQYF